MKEFQATLQYLWSLKRLGSRPGPEITAAVLAALGDPHRAYPSLHITGSKGKGSTAAMCASVLTAAGYRTGLYTSPHLLSFRERAQVDGVMATPQELVEGVARVRKAFQKLQRAGGLERDPTFFEVATTWAFDLFARRHVDAAVVEVGLGGRLDATNVVQAPVTVVTTLELEHTELLGPTIQDIAREKAGIFHRDAWAVTGVGEGEALEELRRHAFRLGVPLWVLGREVVLDRQGPQTAGALQRLTVRTPMANHPDLSLPFPGAFQARNAAVAVAALDLFARARDLKIPEEALRRGLRDTKWPGRLQRLEERPAFYVDAGHTPESAREVVAALRELHPSLDPRESALLFSCLEDKKAEEILDTLAPLATHLVLFALSSERAMSLQELSKAARGRFAQVLLARSTTEAVRLGRLAVGPKGLLLAMGGVYLAGAVLSEVQGIPPEGPDLSDPLPRTGLASLWGAPGPAARAPRARREGTKAPLRKQARRRTT